MAEKIQLGAFERWMVKQNLKYVETDGLEVVIDRLRASGYSRVADGVLQAIETQRVKHDLKQKEREQC